MTENDRLFLDFSVRKLNELVARIGTCLEQLTDEQVWARGAENENAIGNLVLHLCGNVRQWIIASLADQPDLRQRDAEFAARGGASRRELQERLQATVKEAAAIISDLPAENLAARRVIQGYDGSVLEAIYHVVEHFSMHAGQIIFATKMMTGSDLGFYRHLQSGAAHGKATP
ncbi:MAG: hypothetical protein C5B51_10775 [Terriglobia bacterium]|nr:MAG: hypothetical protein C5B51_10775 [Terriglobia bacterium]